MVFDYLNKEQYSICTLFDLENQMKFKSSYIF